MNLLVLDQYSELAGAQRCLLMALEAMRARHWKVSVGLSGNGELFGRAGKLGFETFPICSGPFGLGHKSLFDAARFSVQLPLLIGQIRSLVRSVRPDLLYINGPRLLPAAALAGLELPVLFHAHRTLTSSALRRLAGGSVRRLRAFVVACCRYVADSWKGIGEAHVVLNGVTGPAVNLPVPRGDALPRIGCVGRISPEKGQLEFIAAAKIIQDSFPRARFTVYGAPLFSRDADWYYQRVLAAARGLPIDFPGWIPDVYQALADLDILLVPSTGNEATPLVILEAFAAGVPVIAFSAGGVPEIVEHGRTGFLVDTTDQMARYAIDLLSGDGTSRASVARQARETWQERFTRESFQLRLLRTLELIHHQRALEPAT